ncbi:MAG: hypothetical protein PUF13_10230 [Lachnospiraceae bacterium]|nr:hypothetical protein [Lachnospiraceae bacterium]
MKKVCLRLLSVICLAIVLTWSANVPGAVSEAATKSVQGASTIRKSKTVSCNGTYYVGRLKRQSQTLWYKFKTKDFDAFYTFYAKNLSMSDSFKIYVCTKDEEELFGSGYLHQGNDYTKNIKLKKNTYYYVKVEGYYGTGNFKFQVKARRDKTGDTKAKASVVKTNTYYVFSSDGDLDTDWFRFKPTKSGQYTVYFKNLSMTDSFKGYLVSKYEEDLCGSSYLHKNSEYSNTVYLKKNIWYYIRIEGFYGVGNYKFRIKKV